MSDSSGISPSGFTYFTSLTSSGSKLETLDLVSDIPNASAAWYACASFSFIASVENSFTGMFFGSIVPKYPPQWKGLLVVVPQQS
jgi:hypothetical protein